MLIQIHWTVFRATVFGVICAMASFGSSQEGFSQEPEELSPPAVSTSAVEQVGASIPAEQQVDDAGVETMTRGPLHEAFAEPVISDPAPGMIVNREPPVEINEMAPDFRPDGDDAIWISGYWGWDDQREDFIWISGVYRVPPEGHRWVPGYWHPVQDGWQWVQGFWVEDIAETIVYSSPPPATLENGPSSPSPGMDYFYIPGNWSQSTTGYLWNAGYWHPLQYDLIWIPSHTIWTPRGCIYVNGYWDQRLPQRGLCFAPVFIPRATYSRPGWYLQPNVVLNSQAVLHNLFVQPGYNHYLFGDYYGLPLANRQVIPAYQYHQRRGMFDPLISFYTAYNARQGQDLIGWYGKQHADLRLNPSNRPPQQWSALVSNTNDTSLHSNRGPAYLAHTLDQVNKIDGGLRISPITANIKQDLLKRDSDHKRIAKDRETVEASVGLRGSPLTGAIVAPSLVLPKLEQTNRKNDSVTRITKMPEQPRNLIRDRLNSSDVAAKKVEPIRQMVPVQPGMLSPLGTRTPLGARTVESIPKKLLNTNPPTNLPNQSELLRQTNRNLDRIKQTDVPKVQVPKLQSPPPNRLSGSTDIGPLKKNDPVPKLQSLPPNRLPGSTDIGPLKKNDSVSKGNPGGELRNKPSAPQVGRSGLGQAGPNLSPLSLQGNPPTTRSLPNAQPERQPRLGIQPSNAGSDSSKKERDKKPK